MTRSVKLGLIIIFIGFVAALLFAQNIVFPGPGNFHAAPPAGIPVSDQFNESMLNTSLWTFVSPSGGSQQMTGTQLQLNVPGGANHDPGPADQSVRVAQTIGNVNFIASVKFDSKPTQQYQFEGLTVRQDTNSNYVLFQFGSDGTNLICNAATVVAGTETAVGSQATITGAGASLWMQIQRNAGTWTLLYSLDGTNYTTVSSFAQTYTVNEIDVWGGNFNSTASSSPAFTVLADSFIGATNSGGAPCTNITSTFNVTGQTNQTYDNYCFTSQSGPCVNVTNSTNITFHNVKVGPCASTDTTGAGNGQGFYISGGNHITITDSYIANVTPCIVNNCNTETAFDIGDNIFCTGSPNLTVKGNVMVYGEAALVVNPGSPTCNSYVFSGNFILNTIVSQPNPANNNMQYGGGAGVLSLDGSFGELIDHNYFLECAGGPSNCNGITPLYNAVNGDIVNFGAISSNDVQNNSVTNNYFQEGQFSYGCGINMDGGANALQTSTTSTISNNNLYNSNNAGICIEGGYNYTISNNKVLITREITGGPGVNGFSIFQLYVPSRPCGNVTLTGNLDYAFNTSTSQIRPLLNDGTCSNITLGAGNIFDSGTGPCPSSGSCSAYNAMQPPATQLPVPKIPPVPVSCAAKSPYTNNTSVGSC